MQWTNRRSLLTAALVLLSTPFAPAESPLWGDQLALARLDLELRRAGGPDPARVGGLLARSEPGATAWLVRKARACAAGLVSCTAILPEVTAALAFGVVPADATVLRKAELLAPFDGLEPWQRGEALEGLLAAVATDTNDDERRRARAWAIGLAELALTEGYLDLAPLIRSSWLGQYPSVQDCERYALALEAADPAAALVALVAEAAEGDARAAPGRRDGQAPLAALLALEALRRANPPGVLTDLRDALALYPCPAEAGGAGPESTPAAGFGLTASFGELEPDGERGLASLRRAQRQCLGGLGVSLAELIGDLGDRDTELRAFVGDALAVQVEEGLRREAELSNRDEREDRDCAAGLELPPEVLASLDALLAVRLALEAFAVDNGVYPQGTNLAELEPLVAPYLGPASDRAPWIDGWGHPVDATVRATTFQVRSLGRDGVADEGAPEGAVDGVDRDLVLGEAGLLQWPSALPRQTVELRQRFTHCMYQALEAGMSVEDAIRLLGAEPGECHDAPGGMSTLRWSNRDGSVVVVQAVGGRVVSAAWQPRRLPL